MHRKQAVAAGLALGAGVASQVANTHAANVFGVSATVVGVLIGLLLIAAGWLWRQASSG